jgi:sorbitol-specific phosphotransferase system component IIA
MFKRVSTGFAAGAVLGMVIVGGLLLTDTRVHDPGSKRISSGIPSEEAAQEFIHDWRRMREGTWTTDATYTRVSSDGHTSRSEIHEAQRPPQRIRILAGSTSIEEPGKLTVCAPDTDGAKGQCRTEETQATYAEGVDSEVKDVEQLVSGPASVYGVARSSRHCYALQAIGSDASSSWGEHATFCFDGDTGAMKSTEIVRGGGVTDSITTTSVRSDVKDSEFERANA